SEEERQTVMDCLYKIEAELKHGIDKHSRRLITANIGLLLDYCMRFYERQFTTREEVNKDIIVRFERLLDDYFDSEAPLQEGLPTVKYFADKVFLSANYFGDMIRKQTGQTASEYIQNKLIERAKESLLSTDKTTSEIAYGLGFQYPQHLSRMFKRVTGCTPNEFRSRK
ncbi:helix-turn-helix domain-containing protein, partial [Alistipes putredinis]